MCLFIYALKIVCKDGNLFIITGETILHTVIVRRNYAEVRWILDFYNDHTHSIPGGLAKILTSAATGDFLFLIFSSTII